MPRGWKPLARVGARVHTSEIPVCNRLSRIGNKKTKMKNFKDKVVVITGASSGMGRAYAMAFGKLGAKLALNDYDKKGLDQTAELLSQQNITSVFTKVFDVSIKQDMYAFADEVKSTFGNAHVIINNAGIEGANKPLYLITEEEYEKIMGINFYGVLYGCKAFLPQLVANNEGAVVNVSSVFGMIGPPGQSDYCASKFAVRGLTKSLMVEFHKSPISIHSLHPGGIDTNIAKLEKSKPFAKKYLTTSPEKIVNHVIKSIKNGQPKIVYGNDSFRAWFAANFISKRLLKKILWMEMKKTIDYEADYKGFIKE